MTDLPILFSTRMVRALLKGRKTQTRRVLNPQPSSKCFGFKKVFAAPPYFEAFDALNKPVYAFPYPKHCVSPFPKIRIGIGDRLYVREATALHYFDYGRHGYRADWSDDAAECLTEPRWTPSIHVPRSASRLTLLVTDVRVQKLHDISDVDACAEGCDYRPSMSPRQGFEMIWGIINGPDAWLANPWVYALTFDVIRQNIDEVEKVISA